MYDVAGYTMSPYRCSLDFSYSPRPLEPLGSTQVARLARPMGEYGLYGIEYLWRQDYIIDRIDRVLYDVLLMKNTKKYDWNVRN